ncbi:MAG TPA: monovalent cation/H+ antiporter complex subunit F [Egibacteraceae bacterium]|nr:monovalent cation/H+ antiporter complex subunit F [Egibacteraceae bacterium]
MAVVVAVCLAILAVAALLCVARLLMAETVADRVVALDLLLGVIVTGIATAAVATRSGELLALLVVTSLLAFVATVTVARFVERRGL